MQLPRRPRVWVPWTPTPTPGQTSSRPPTSAGKRRWTSRSRSWPGASSSPWRRWTQMSARSSLTPGIWPSIKFCCWGSRSRSWMSMITGPRLAMGRSWRSSCRASRSRSSGSRSATRPPRQPRRCCGWPPPRQPARSNPSCSHSASQSTAAPCCQCR